MRQPPKRVLDLFCGAGGAAMGLHQAWPEAEIVGVDIKPQPRYPFKFVQADAMAVLANLSRGDFLGEFEPDFIWASPPCQKYSVGSHWVRGRAAIKDHPDLIADVRRSIQWFNLPFVIENVPQAPLLNPVFLCGSMFGLHCAKGYLKRHRNFEAPFPIEQLKCSHGARAVSVSGHGAGGMFGYRKANADEARELMGISWASREGVREAIPPAYSRYIAGQYLKGAE